MWSIRTSQTEGNNQALFTYCDIASKNQKQAPVPESFIFPRGLALGESGECSADGGIVSLSRSPTQKAPASLWTCGPGGGREGRTRSGKVLSQSGEKCLN